jgi:hypothetical protein
VAGWFITMSVLLAVGSCGSPSEPGFEDTTHGATLHYVIPAGTGARLDAGEEVEILPASLTVRVGDVIRIDNLDDRTHAVGPFSVGSGQSLTQRFSSPGTLEGVCSVHPDGRLRLVVEP